MIYDENGPTQAEKFHEACSELALRLSPSAVGNADVQQAMELILDLGYLAVRLDEQAQNAQRILSEAEHDDDESPEAAAIIADAEGTYWGLQEAADQINNLFDTERELTQ